MGKTTIPKVIKTKPNMIHLLQLNSAMLLESSILCGDSSGLQAETITDNDDEFEAYIDYEHLSRKNKFNKFNDDEDDVMQDDRDVANLGIS